MTIFLVVSNFVLHFLSFYGYEGIDTGIYYRVLCTAEHLQQIPNEVIYLGENN